MNYFGPYDDSERGSLIHSLGTEHGSRAPLRPASYAQSIGRPIDPASHMADIYRHGPIPGTSPSHVVQDRFLCPSLVNTEDRTLPLATSPTTTLPVGTPNHLGQRSHNAMPLEPSTKAPTRHDTYKRLRCLKCRLGKGNRSCKGTPLCKGHNDSQVHGDPPLGAPLETAVYLDWQTLFASLQALKKALLMAHKHSESLGAIVMDLREPVILEMTFEEQVDTPFRWQGTAIAVDKSDSLDDVSGSPTREARLPMLNMDQLDSFVRVSMWGKPYAISNHRNLSPTESELMSIVQLFTGYFSLLRHLNITKLHIANHCNDTIRIIVAVELVYTLVFRLQKLFMDLGWCCEKLRGENRNKTHAPVMTDALEILHRMVRASQDYPWHILPGQETQTLARFYFDFLRRSSHMLTRIENYDCRVLGESTARGFKRNQPMRDLARSEGTRRLPIHCHISIIPSVPLSHWSTQQSVVRASQYESELVTDILLQQPPNNALSGIPLPDNSLNQLPRDLLRADNSVVNLEQLWQATIQRSEEEDGDRTDRSSPQPTEFDVVNPATQRVARLVQSPPELVTDDESDQDMEDVNTDGIADPQSIHDAQSTGYLGFEYGYWMRLQ